MLNLNFMEIIFNDLNYLYQITFKIRKRKRNLNCTEIIFQNYSNSSLVDKNLKKKINKTSQAHQ